MRTPELDALQADIGFGGHYATPESTVSTNYGLKMYGVPYGNACYIKEELRGKAARLEGNFRRIKDIVDLAKHTEPHIPARQNLWILTLNCLQHMGSYWARHLLSELTLDFCTKLDAEPLKLVKLATTIDYVALPSLVKEWIRTPSALTAVAFATT